MPIVVRIDVELAKRKMSVGEFAERVGLTPANVGRAEERSRQGGALQHPGGHVPRPRMSARRPTRVRRRMNQKGKAR